MKMGVGAGTMLTVRPEVQQREQAGRREVFFSFVDLLMRAQLDVYSRH